MTNSEMTLRDTLALRLIDLNKALTAARDAHNTAEADRISEDILILTGTLAAVRTGLGGYSGER